jgi:heptosyltransferase-2
MSASVGPELPQRLGPAPRVLVARLDGIGDCILGSGLLAGLRQLFPAAHVTGAFSEATAPLFEACPFLDRVVALPLRPIEARAALLDPPYDLAICPRWDVDAWGARGLALLSQAPVRVGFDRGAYRYDTPHDGWAGAYFTHLARTRADVHEVAKCGDLLRFLGFTGAAPAPSLWLTAVVEAWAEAWLGEHGLADFAVLTVAAGWPGRAWPVANFLQVIDALAARGLRCIVVGGADAVPAGHWLVQRRPRLVVSAAGALTLSQTAAVTARARLYVGMDTGPMHLAAARGVPVVEISRHPLTGRADHPNAPERFAPFGAAHRVLQPVRPLPPCSEEGCVREDEPHCIMQVTAEAVVGAALALLGEGRNEIVPVSGAGVPPAGGRDARPTD